MVERIVFGTQVFASFCLGVGLLLGWCAGSVWLGGKLAERIAGTKYREVGQGVGITVGVCLLLAIGVAASVPKVPA